MYTTTDDIQLPPLRWVNVEKNRYYRIFLTRDLLGDWLVTKSWGSLSNASGRVTHVACLSLDEAKKMIEKIAQTRLRRGYISR
jgi:hypothetical protein